MLGLKWMGSMVVAVAVAVEVEVVAVCKLLVIVLLMVDRSSIEVGDTILDTEMID